MLGALRLHLGRELGLIDESAWRFVWITDFPMFEWDEDDGRWTAVHHPFTRPAPGSEELVASDPGAATALAYDLVVNGIEIGGGSFRIHEQELQAQCLRRAASSPPRSSGGSSASCSTRSRWARRRTAASRSGSSAC